MQRAKSLLFCDTPHGITEMKYNESLEIAQLFFMDLLCPPLPCSRSRTYQAFPFQPKSYVQTKGDKLGSSQIAWA